MQQHKESFAEANTVLDEIENMLKHSKNLYGVNLGFDINMLRNYFSKMGSEYVERFERIMATANQVDLR